MSYDDPSIIATFDIHKYDKLKTNTKIAAILNNMPSNLTDLEKAYYVYLELGKILSQSIPYLYAPNRIFSRNYYDAMIDEEFYGVCRPMSELYACILNDDRIGLDCDVVLKRPTSYESHADNIITIDGKHYMLNLISDLYRIQTSKRTLRFGFEVSEAIENIDEDYFNALKRTYGTISKVPTEELERMDKKLGYSYCNKFDSKNSAGIYTEDVLMMIYKELHQKQPFEEYVLKGQDPKEVDILKCKMDFIFAYINKFTHFIGDIKPLELKAYFTAMYRKFFSAGERSRIKSTNMFLERNPFDLVSIVTLCSDDKDGLDIFYVLDPKAKTYVEKTEEEIRQMYGFSPKVNRFEFNRIFEHNHSRESSGPEL